MEWSKGAAPCVLHIRVITCWCVTCHLQSVLSLAICSLCCHLSFAVLLNSVFTYYERYKPNIKRTDMTQCDWTQHDRAAKRLWWKIQDKTGTKRPQCKRFKPHKGFVFESFQKHSFVVESFESDRYDWTVFRLLYSWLQTFVLTGGCLASFGQSLSLIKLKNCHVTLDRVNHGVSFPQSFDAWCELVANMWSIYLYHRKWSQQSTCCT